MPRRRLPEKCVSRFFVITPLITPWRSHSASVFSRRPRAGPRSHRGLAGRSRAPASGPSPSAATVRLHRRPTLILRSLPETNIDSNAHPPLPPVYTHVLPRVANAHRRLLRRCHASRPREPHAPGRARHRRPRRGWGKPVPAGRRQRHLGYPQHGLRGPREASRRQERARGGFLTEGRTRFQGEGVPRAAGLLRRAQRGRGGPSQADVRQVSEPIGERDELKKANARARSTYMTGARKLRPCSGGSEPPRCAVGPPRANCARERRR